jgi:hypothetical protein
MGRVRHPIATPHVALHSAAEHWLSCWMLPACLPVRMRMLLLNSRVLVHPWGEGQRLLSSSISLPFAER